jgi:hypothetical protein
MSTLTAASTATAGAPLSASKHAVHEKMSKGPGKAGILIFVGVLLAGLIFIGTSIAKDLGNLSWDPRGPMSC